MARARWWPSAPASPRGSPATAWPASLCRTGSTGRSTAAKARGALGGDIDGMLADFVVLKENGLVAIPDHLSFQEAATLPCAAVTAWNALGAGDSSRARRF